MVADHRSESCLRAKYWDEGKSQVEIAEELGVSRVTVLRWMKKHNIEKRSRSEIESEGDIGKLKNERWVREQYQNQGRSTVDIADELEVGSNTVRRWIKKHGIEVRSISECRSDGDVEKLKNEEWLREQYKNEQKSQVEIAEELGVDSTTVGNWMDRHNIETRSKSEIESEGDIGRLMNETWVREEYINQQKTTYEIADELDVSSSTVSNWMKRHGIETRRNWGNRSNGDIEKLKDGEWLREEYINQQKTTYEIAGKLNVSHSTVCRWLKRHGINIRSSIINPENTRHIVRSEWELEVCNILIEAGVDYDYESIEIEYCDGSTYVPDFVTDEYVIEVKGAYFSEIHDKKNTEREKALATIESLDGRDYVVVGQELPADIHIPWDERARVQDLFC